MTLSAILKYETEKRTMAQSRRLLSKDAAGFRWILDYFRKQPRSKEITEHSF